VGTLLACCRRAVTAALRQMGSGSDIDCSGPQKLDSFWGPLHVLANW
jgi:hypothetical protein